MLKRIAFLIAIVFAVGTVSAQVTTSSISGLVKDPTGAVLAGASVTAVHVPSGSRYSAVSQTNGRFSIPNMRSGGPYHIEVTYVGFQPQKYDDIYIKLAEDYVLNTDLTSTDQTLTNVVVTGGRRNPILNSSRTGAVTNLGRRDIERLPSITRNINDLTRATPQSNGSSIAGGNYRQNNFTIDGSDFNNSFGIGTNLPANGAPISLDAIEEISVSISPFDVRQSGFIGSAINAVTRAGTNTFSGSVYNYFRTEKQQGDKVGKTTFIRPPFEFKQYGFRVGGPIIKNKLFFFFNYETENQPKTVQTRFAATSSAPFGSAPNIARPTADSLNIISQYLLDNYGYQTGPYDNYNTEIKRTKYMGRIDWNISQNHHLVLRYSQVEGGEPNGPSTSVSGSNYPGFPTGQGRADNNTMWYKNSNYLQGANFYSGAVELNSRFGKFANVLRGTYTFQNDSRESDSQQFPFVDILGAGGSPYASFGYELFSYGNLRKVKMYSVMDNVTWQTNKHNWTLGLQADISQTINGFQRFGTSQYIFNSWNDFISGENPVNFALTYSNLPGFAQAFPSFKFAQYSAYAQDEISVTNNFKLTLGVRVDRPDYLDVKEVQTNPYLLAATFADGLKLNTGVLPKTRLMFSPRIGFNYDLYGDRSMQIRGGTGIFTGKVPFVWIVSQSGDAGMLQTTVGFNGQTATPGPFNPDPRAYLPANPAPAGSVIPTSTDALSPNFQFPQTWKSSLGFDTKLPWNTVFTMEAIFNKDINTSYFKNVNLAPPAALNVAGYPDNRMIYPNATNVKFLNPILATPKTNSSILVAPGTNAPAGSSIQALNAIQMSNGKRGYYFSISAQLVKQFSRGLSAGISYTKSIGGNTFDGNGDQPLSAWQGTAITSLKGANDAVLGYAGFVLPDRLSANISYKHEYLKHLATTISIFFNGSIDGRFSYVYGADFNRDGYNGNDLIYIPKDASEITFVSKTVNGVTYSAQDQSDLFFKYIDQDKYLRKHKGQYAERNGAQFPWRNQMDVKFIQDLFVNVGKNRNTIQFSIDIFNFGNLLNSSWSKIKTVNAPAILVPQNVASLVPGGTVKPTFQLATDRLGLATQTFRDNVSTTSTYFMQFGIRYLFN